MRILYVVGDPAIRLSESTGQTRHITECVHAMETLGHEVRIIMCTGEESSVRQKRAFEKAKRLLPNSVSTILKDLARLVQDVRFGSRIELCAAEFQPAFIYNRHAIFHRSGVKTARKLGIPSILEVNAIVTREADRYFGVGLRSLANRIEMEAFRTADAIVVVSEKLREELEEYGVPSNKISVNPNGADPERFNPARDASGVRRRHGLEGMIVVGFIGSMVPWHGVPNLLDAAREICSKHPQVRFLIVGAWDKDRAMVKRAQEYGIGDKVVFTGPVSLDEAPLYINAMDIAAAPYADPTQVYGSSTKCIEYMAAGRAVIASRLGQMADMIQHGVSGILVTPGDSRDLTNAILYLIDKPDVRAQIGAAARKVVLERYTWQQNAERILDIYHSIIGSRTIEGVDV